MDLEDKIKPALNIIHGKELSTEEFQHSLFEYFEEKGILSNLRAHLRSQMVNVLQETCLGKAIISKKPEISPKLQAQNLLIAEYLLQRNYHYTLSVLSSEVPLNNVFPSKPIDCQNKSPAFRFAKNDLSDILEAIGFNRQPELADMLLLNYKSNDKESLLTCILQSVPGLIGQCNTAKQENVNTWLSKQNMNSLNLESMIGLFRSAGVHIDTILQICELVKEAIVKEVSSLKQLKDDQLSKMKKKMHHEASCKIKRYKEKVAKLETFYKQEKRRLENELKNTKANLNEATNQVQAKYNDINELNTHIKELEARLKQQEVTLLTKELTLQQRQEYLENRQSQIDQQFDEIRLVSRSQQALPIVIETCEQETGMRKTECKDTGTKTITGTTASVETMENQREVELVAENTQLKQSSAEMQDKITKLKDENISYQNKIQELLLRTNSLLTQLESRGYDGRIRSTISMRNMRLFFQDGGEEDQIGPASSPHESRRKKPPCIVIPCSSSDEITPTDEVLQEAKERLLELERESAAIDKHFETLPKGTLRTVDSNAACLIQNFQSNVALIRDSLTKIFPTETRHNPTPQSIHSELNIPGKNCVNNTNETHEFTEVIETCNAAGDGPQVVLECKSKPPEIDVICEEDEEIDVYNSTTSSGMIINTSISTVDVSEEAGRCSSPMWLDVD